ncbi:hypothetical protein BS78_08G101000 [Paspalum vaginatum]|nr:hypothetical protein BS78_08G101000 [Paspalum vaginatum]
MLKAALFSAAVALFVAATFAQAQQSATAPPARRRSADRPRPPVSYPYHLRPRRGRTMQHRSIVWVANRQNPITGGSGSLTLTTSSLELLNRTGNPVWSNAFETQNSPQAFLIDSGNLIVSDTVSCNLLWQGFDHPSDTLLPGIRIGYDTSTNDNSFLTS